MTYPLKYREKVFALKEKNNWTFEETAKHFEIPARTLFRWSKRLEPILKHKKHKSKIDKNKLLEDVELYGDSYLCERSKRLGVSITCVWSTLKKLKISYKKKPKASESR
jgi:transposase